MRGRVRLGEGERGGERDREIRGERAGEREREIRGGRERR